MLKETMSSSCVNRIKNLILNGELLPGEKIKGDYLKSYLNTGLSPIREALARLISTGLVELNDNVGFKVPLISKGNLLDFYKSYAKIEQLLFKESIECGDKNWESRVVSALYHLSKVETLESKVNYKMWSSVNEEFHEALISGCNLIALRATRDNFLLCKTWYHNLAYAKFENELISINHNEHSRIAELALSRNVELSSDLLYRHTMHSFNSVVLKLERNGYLTSL